MSFQTEPGLASQQSFLAQEGRRLKAMDGAALAAQSMVQGVSFFKLRLRCRYRRSLPELNADATCYPW